MVENYPDQLKRRIEWLYKQNAKQDYEQTKEAAVNTTQVPVTDEQVQQLQRETEKTMEKLVKNEPVVKSKLRKQRHEEEVKADANANAESRSPQE
jgi:cbb3-type cytochrome oxidase cytochrome c subunit